MAADYAGPSILSVSMFNVCMYTLHYIYDQLRETLVLGLRCTLLSCVLGEGIPYPQASRDLL